MSLTPIRQLAATAVAAILSACAGEPETFELTGHTMGTGYSVKVVSGNDAPPLEPLARRIAERLATLDDRFSTYRATSEISRFNAQPGLEWFEISRPVLEVLSRGMTISELSDGAFDMTVAPLVARWGFGPDGSPGTIPPQSEIDALLAATGFEHLEIRDSPPGVRRTRPGVRLDLSAIAKGFAVDRICELLDGAGLTAYTVEIGGEVRTRGLRADGGDWMIGIENQVAAAVTPADTLHEVVRLRNAAIATSGDYRNYFVHDGKRYSHTLDPKTGWPVSHDLAAVSVVAERAADADALATALMVLGPEQGLQLALREAIAARWMLRTGDGLEVVHSPAYATYVADH